MVAYIIHTPPLSPLLYYKLYTSSRLPLPPSLLGYTRVFTTNWACCVRGMTWISLLYGEIRNARRTLVASEYCVLRRQNVMVNKQKTQLTPDTLVLEPVNNHRKTVENVLWYEVVFY